MRCRYCQRTIGAIRLLYDQNYCSGKHRKLHFAASARALRDAGEFAGLTDRDLDAQDVIFRPQTKRTKPTNNLRDLLALLGVLTLCGFGLALWQKDAAPEPKRRKESSGEWLNALVDRVRTHVQSPARVRLSDDFRAGLDGWISPGQRLASGVSEAMGSRLVQPGQLRLWKPTLGLANYQMDFEGTIERRSVGWVFRAAGASSYYAAKVVAPTKGQPGSEIVRFIVQNGKEGPRTRLPIPVLVQAGTPYRFQVSVQGDRFATYVDGQLIDLWSDRRLRSGGVGFFAEKGESASIRWVSLSDRRETGFFRRLLGFGTLVGPLAD